MSSSSTPSQLARLLKRFPHQRILVIGDLMLDRYILGHVRRISPEAPIPVVETKIEDERAGGAANVAMNLAALGAQVSCAGFVGRDPAGHALRASLEDKGIDCSALVVTHQRPTTTKTRVIAQHQQVVRIDHEDASPVSSSLTASIQRKLLPLLASFDGIILSDYNKGLFAAGLAEGIIAEAKRQKKILTVDPKPQNIAHFKGATLITPNKGEAEGACQKSFHNETELAAGGADLRNKLNFDAVLITRGEEGMSLCDDSGHTHIPTVAKRVFDVTGAGDSVVATVTLALCAGASFIDAAHLSNLAAGISVENVGAYAVSNKELAAVLKH